MGKKSEKLKVAGHLPHDLDMVPGMIAHLDLNSVISGSGVPCPGPWAFRLAICPSKIVSAFRPAVRPLAFSRVLEVKGKSAKSRKISKSPVIENLAKCRKISKCLPNRESPRDLPMGGRVEK